MLATALGANQAGECGEDGSLSRRSPHRPISCRSYVLLLAASLPVPGAGRSAAQDASFLPAPGLEVHFEGALGPIPSPASISPLFGRMSAHWIWRERSLNFLCSTFPMGASAPPISPRARWMATATASPVDGDGIVRWIDRAAGCRVPPHCGRVPAAREALS